MEQGIEYTLKLNQNQIAAIVAGLSGMPLAKSLHAYLAVSDQVRVQDEAMALSLAGAPKAES